MTQKYSGKRHNNKTRLSRRIGKSLHGKSLDRAYPPGQHGIKGKKKLSGYGEQLEAKQILRGFYGNITERQFRKTFVEAARRKGDTGENLVGLLESRLDNAVCRSGFAVTPFAARQLVSHGHILVNGKCVTIASYLLKPGDIVEVRQQSKSLLAIEEAVQRSGQRGIPEYYNVDSKTKTSTYVKIPELSEIPYPVPMNLNLIIEFYSR